MDAAFTDAYLMLLGSYVMGISVVPLYVYVESLWERASLRKRVKEEIKKYNTVLSMTKTATLDLLCSHIKENTHDS